MAAIRSLLAQPQHAIRRTPTIIGRTFNTHAQPTFLSLQDEFEPESWPEFKGDDATAVGHLMLRQQREYLHYLRLIESEVPRLQAFRQPFVPPPKSKSITLRTMWYGGEPHPAERKAVVVIPVSSLPLKTPEALHKFKLLAGPRWDAEPPRDGGFGGEEVENVGKEGFVKIACEDFDTQSLNMKWCSDVLTRMVEESNDGKDTFQDIPHDTRHLEARARKQKLGNHHSKRAKRPTIRDFPQEWLPQSTAPSAPSSPLTS